MSKIVYKEVSPYTLSYLLDMLSVCNVKQLIRFKNSNGWAILSPEVDRIKDACKCMKPMLIPRACEGLERELLDDFDKPLFEDVDL